MDVDLSLTLCQVTDNPVDPNADEDPYNLEEIASQFINDDEQPATNPSTVANKQGNDLNNAASEEVKNVETNEIGNVRALDNNPSCFSDIEDFFRPEITGFEGLSKSPASKLIDPLMNPARRKHVSFQDFLSSEDEDIESESSTNHYTRIKVAESLSGSGTGDPADVIPSSAIGAGSSADVIPPSAAGTSDPARVIPPSATIESSFLSCEEDDAEPSSITSDFTRIKEKARKINRKSTEESYDVIPPTASLNRGVQSRIVKDEDNSEQSSRSSENFSEMSSSNEEGSDEGLFTKPKGKRKRKPKLVFGETSKVLKEGRSRLRR